MPKFRKKPVAVDAYQMTMEAAHQHPSKWPDWLQVAWRKAPSFPGAMYMVDAEANDDRYWLRTLEGGFSVDWDDWIIKGIQGELYPCKPDIFEATYDEVCD